MFPFLTTRVLGLILWLAGVVLISCGREERVQGPEVDLEYKPPVYAILPDDAPLRAQLEEAAGVIEKDLLEEQQKFLLKRPEEVRARYLDPKGKLLVSKDSFARVEAFMESQAPARMSTQVQAFELRVPMAAAPPGTPVGNRDTGQVYLLGDTIQAVAFHTDQVSVHTLRVRALYRYRFDSTDAGPSTAELSVLRETTLTKTSSGKWIRTRIDEQVQN